MTEYIIKVLPKHGKFPHLPGKGVFLFDLLLALIAFVLTTFIHAALSPISINWPVFSIQAAICVAVTGLFYYIFKTNSGLLRYFTFKDTFRIWFALLCANVVLTIIHLAVYQRPFFTLAIFFVNFLLTFIFVFFFRISVRLIFDYVTKFHENKSKRLPVLVYGVEPSNISLAEMIDIDETSSYQIAGFISPSSNISNQKIISKPVYFRDTFYSNIRKFHDVEAILIQPEEITRTEKQLLAEICYQNKIELLSVPSIQKWDDKKTHEIKNFNIEDLLGRTQIEIDTETIKKNLKTKKVLITGAAGSIGSEIVRQLCLLDVDLLILCDNAETPLHQLCLNLKNSFPHVKFVSIIADVRNRNKMEHIFSIYKPHCVYHAAAYKHVPMMEDHPCEAVLTNVSGSKNVADMAVVYGAENYVMISTDKAVNPSSVMGATKRIAEIYIQSMSRVSSTRFITTRFGNVLGSSGSVIPLFEKQIEKGGPITLTDPKITRYFMTIPEACSLVLEASSFGKGGEIFIFDMGEPVRIRNLAEDMIRLSGYEPYKDIDVIITGLRPGEKLYEELLYDGETYSPTCNKKILVRNIRGQNIEDVLPLLNKLIETADTYDNMEIVKVMKQIVPEFKSVNSKFGILDLDKE